MAKGDSPQYTDIAAERAVLSVILRHGVDALVTCDSYGILPRDFFYHTNSTLFHIVSEMIKEKPKNRLDKFAILTRMRNMGFEKEATQIDDGEYIDALAGSNVLLDSMDELCLSVRKNSVFRDVVDRIDGFKQSVEDNITSSSSMEDLFSIVRSGGMGISEAVVNPNQKLIKLGDGIDEFIKAMDKADNARIGLSSGFPLWDAAISNIRSGTINLVAARSGVGKSWFGLTVANFLSSLGIPVLYLDTEMEREYQRIRFLAMKASVRINDIESGRISKDPRNHRKVDGVREKMKEQPLFFEYVGGKNIDEILAIATKFGRTEIGRDDNGNILPSLVVLDYLKIMGSNRTGGLMGLKELAEWQLLGHWSTKLQDFAMQCPTSILFFVQTNRSGVDNESDIVVAGSDRIKDVCASLTLLKKKDEDELSETGQFGQLKALILKSRYAAGLEPPDYINFKSELSYGLLKEGEIASIAGRSQNAS